MKKISERDIETGNVMGPILVVALCVVLVGMCAWASPLILLVAVTSICGLVFFVYIWFSAIPRTYNWLVDRFSQ